MHKPFMDEPRGAGQIKSSPLTPEDTADLTAAIQASKRRNAPAIDRIRAKMRPAACQPVLPR